MDLKKLALFRNKIKKFEKTSYGFRGIFNVSNNADLNLLSKFNYYDIREIFYSENNKDADIENLEIGDTINIAIDLQNFKNYFETFEDFLLIYKYEKPQDIFYLNDISYLSNDPETKPSLINNYFKIIEVVNLLKKVSTYTKLVNNNRLELLFTQPDKSIILSIDYSKSDIENLSFEKRGSEIDEDISYPPYVETKKRLFANEVINLISEKGKEFPTILKEWNNLILNYDKSLKIFVSEFSFKKINASSQKHFQNLTDNIYSVINKFSGYIFAIPVAYILIIRFYDFEGNSLFKDSILLFISILYFLLIWCVLLNNLKNAFKYIEKDINRLIDRINSEDSLSEIKDELKSKRDKLIPKEKNKICFVRIISIIILFITIGAYLCIYWNELLCKMR